MLVMAFVLSASAVPPARGATYVKSIDLNAFLPPTGGVHVCHVAVDPGASPLTVYVSTLNNSGSTTTSVPLLKIVDPLGASPTVSVLDTNTMNGAGVSATRGYGGVSVDGTGAVYAFHGGNGDAAGSRLRRYTREGAAAGDFDNTSVAERLGGCAASMDKPGYVLATRFTQSTSNEFSHFTVTTTTLGKVNPPTPGTIGDNPRDCAYNDLDSRLYVNENGLLRVYAPGNAVPPADITNAAAWDAANGATATTLLSGTANSFAGHGVGVSVNGPSQGKLVGFTPPQSAGNGYRTVKIVNQAGVLIDTLGTDSSKGNGSTGLLGRPTDVAISDNGTSRHFFVADFDDAGVASRTWNRVAVFSATFVPVAVSAASME